MQKISTYSFPVLIKMLNGKKVHMVSDCEFFPNFDITGQIIGYRINNNELIFKVKIFKNSKIVDVGSNMKNLSFELINKQ